MKHSPDPDSAPAPPLWMVHGFRAALDWDGFAGLYVASVPALPGCFAHGATRGETLRALAAAIGSHTGLSSESCTDGAATVN